MKLSHWLVASSIVLALVACGESTPPLTESVKADLSASNATEKPSATSELALLSDNFMKRAYEDNAYLKLMSGEPITSLPNNTLVHAQEGAVQASTWLAQLRQIDRNALEHQDQLSAAMLEHKLQLAIEAPKHYWPFFDVTPYQAGFVFSSLLTPALKGATLANAEDVAGYLELISDVGRYVGDQLERLKGQQERGILLPKAAIGGVKAAYTGLQHGLPALTAVDDSRLAALSGNDRQLLTTGIEKALSEDVLPRVDALLVYLDEDYSAGAPESVGTGQYPGGKEAYRYAVSRETTLDLTPENIHQRGLDYVATLQAEMKAIRDELGFEGTQQEFHTQMRKDVRFYAKTPEEVEQRYMAYIEKIEPLISDYFSRLPKAPYGVKRLDLASEAGMTFGYYSVPTAASDKGLYFYNGSQLDNRPMVWTAALIFHELIPGHHFHLALQNENTELSDFRRKTSDYTAFTEGWANYAASLAGEMGLLDDPMEHYGWLLFDSFISVRLVLDTGMNYFAWPLEKARAYMLENTFSSEAEVATETLRYSTDLPAQALAYKLGFEKIKALRAAAQARLGKNFDIKEFHAAAVGSGAMPLHILEKHVNRTLK